MTPRFITLEGGDGAGKSTQLRALMAHLRARGIDVVATREVGGAPGAEDIRALWLSKAKDFWEPMTEAFLVMAARKEHLEKTIKPALARGQWVISDRYVDSTRCYQGIGLGLGVAAIDALYAQIARGFWPDKTFILDMPVADALARMRARQGPDDRYQQQDEAFHECLRNGFLELAAADEKRLCVIDASSDPAQVTARLVAQIDALIDEADA